MKFFLARDGVAFGPYTEHQLRESVRLRIFEDSDLALAENAKEWLALREHFPLQSSFITNELGKADADVVGGISLRQAQHASTQNSFWNHPPMRRKLALAAIPVFALLCVMAATWGMFGRTPHVAPVSKAANEQEPTRRVKERPETIPLISPAVVPREEPIVLKDANDALIEHVPTDTSQEKSQADPVASVPNHEPFAPSVANSDHRRKLEGQIHISARNGIIYEPASVEVRLYPLSQLKPYLDKRNAEASAKFVELKTQIAAAEAEKNSLRKAADAAFDAYVQAGSGNREALERASIDAKKAREKATNALYALLQSREDLLSGAFYLEELPESKDVARTDSQGRFDFNVPADGEFAVVAGMQNGSDGFAERYYWFLPVSIDGELRKTLLLSNNNISSHGSVDSLVQTAD